jgi:signal peptidase II
MKPIKSHYLILLGAAVVIIDQFLKLFLSALLADAEFFIAQNDFFSAKLYLLSNPYLAFGIKLPATLIIGLLSVIAVALVLLLKNSLQKQRIVNAVCFSLIAGAALSNIADRIFRGAVLDYLTLSFRQFEWATFNLADAIITLAVIALILNELKKKGQKRE